eukprot:m.180400 g.180400  ORF g.180400 m.180400 type:complete len:82 (-) comp15498_c2_seq3:1679-1924(-)
METAGRDDQWICANCRSGNGDERKDCFKCGQAKPTGLQANLAGLQGKVTDVIQRQMLTTTNPVLAKQQAEVLNFCFFKNIK